MLDINGHEIEAGDYVRAIRKEDDYILTLEGEVSEVNGEILIFKAQLGHVNAIRPNVTPVTLRPRLPQTPETIVIFYDPNFLQARPAVLGDDGQWRYVADGRGEGKVIESARLNDVKVIFDPKVDGR